MGRSDSTGPVNNLSVLHLSSLPFSTSTFRSIGKATSWTSHDHRSLPNIKRATFTLYISSRLDQYRQQAVSLHNNVAESIVSPKKVGHNESCN